MVELMTMTASFASEPPPSKHFDILFGVCYNRELGRFTRACRSRNGGMGGTGTSSILPI
ncbi:MAG: hypothetical protein ACLUOI_32600 [Eisenbergiella sp.]